MSGKRIYHYDTLSITVDESGQLWHHTFIAKPADRKKADDLLGLDTHEAICEGYRERMVTHVGDGLEVRTESKEDGTILSFALPRDKAKLKEGVLSQNAKGFGDITDETYRWLGTKGLRDSKFPVYQLGEAGCDVLRRDKEFRTLPEVLALADWTFGKEDSSEGKLAEHLKNHSDFLDELTQRLKVGGIPASGFKLAGRGGTGVFLEAEGGVVVSIREIAQAIGEHTATARQPIPQHLQPLATFVQDGYEIEITPKLDVTKDPKLVDKLSQSIEATPSANSALCFSFTDAEERNVGTSAVGTAYVLDGNAISLFQIDKDQKTSQSATQEWLNSDGTWKQYTEFKSLHQAFNSPLHQAGGKLSVQGKSFGNAGAATSSNRNALIALFAGGAALIGGLFNLKKKETVEPTKEGEEPKEKTSFSTGAIIATTVGVLATGWAVMQLVGNRKEGSIAK